MSMSQEQLGIVIADLREKAGISGNELAKRAGISQPYLWQIEQGEKDPPLSTISAIADALGVPLKKIFAAA